ncbi:MAG: hypothetical protein HQK61_07120 [Desulfamplus sp.]|nr:hypothetical protein [Desulfamplus sp.]
MGNLVQKRTCSISFMILVVIFMALFTLPQKGIFAEESDEKKSSSAKSSDTNMFDGKASDTKKPDKQKSGEHNDKAVQDNDKKSSSIEMLASIIELKKSLEKRISEKKKTLENSSSDNEKENIAQDLGRLDKQLEDANFDFESIATGVDMGLFAQKKIEEFNWQNEVLSLVEPGIKELKRLTLKARQKTKIKEEIGYYTNLVPVADQAIENINLLISTTPDKEIKKYLKGLIPEWTGMKDQLDNKLKIAQMQLAQMESEETSLVESSQTGIKNFFKTRGLYLFMALLACFAVIVFLRVFYITLIKIIPDYKSEYRPFYIRVIDLFFKISALMCTIFALIFVFYSAEDWVLLSLTIIFLMGLGWAVKHSIPILWQQSRLMLNVGSAREGERIVYNGVPWIVKSINVFCRLENPWLDMSIRLPIEDLMGQMSRPVKKGEPWFPCKKNDWVILSDGIIGKVTSLSHEMVEIIQHGGARKVYQTQDFLSLSPLNLSTNFRISVMFGIGYSHQKDVTSSVPETLHAYITEQMEKEKLSSNLQSLKVEFSQAGASSLDLVILADFDGKMAPQYSRLNRAIQRWCVDACTANNWDIPFPQLTVHKG